MKWNVSSFAAFAMRVGRAPGRVEAAHEVAAVERVVAVDGLAGLLARGQPRVEEPAVARRARARRSCLPSMLTAVKQRERARAVHDDAEVVVAQLGRGDRGASAGPGAGSGSGWARKAGS